MKVRINQRHCHPWMTKHAYVWAMTAQPNVLLCLVAEKGYALYMPP